jgi:simple sugar transport system ATP-binding protein
MQADGLSLRDATDAFSLDGASFTISWGETVGIAGVEGNGQSELGMILADLADLADLGAGRWFADGRELMRAARQNTCAGVATVLEDRHAVACATQMSVAQNMLDSRLPQVSRIGLIDRGSMRAEAGAMMVRFDVHGAGPDARFGGLSGGTRQKAAPARELIMANLKFLPAVQPTRSLDVRAVEAVCGLTRSACAGGAGVPPVSSELDEILTVADRLLAMHRGRIVNQRSTRPVGRLDDRTPIGAMMAGQGI